MGKPRRSVTAIEPAQAGSIFHEGDWRVVRLALEAFIVFSRTNVRVPQRLPSLRVNGHPPRRMKCWVTLLSPLTLTTELVVEDPEGRRIVDLTGINLVHDRIEAASRALAETAS